MKFRAEVQGLTEADRDYQTFGWSQENVEKWAKDQAKSKKQCVKIFETREILLKTICPPAEEAPL
jgi:hypothetical protein